MQFLIESKIYTAQGNTRKRFQQLALYIYFKLFAQGELTLLSRNRICIFREIKGQNVRNRAWSAFYGSCPYS